VTGAGGLGGRALLRAARSRLGGRALAYLADRDPGLLLAPLGWALSKDARLPERLPERIDTFESCAPLVLSSNAANRGVAAMRLDEAALLWRLAASVRDGLLVEIGRERGGSTLLLAGALQEGAELHSYDPQTKLASLDFDAELAKLLARHGREGRVHLHVADSHTAPIPAGRIGLVLVDGDPSYEGTRLDFERWCVPMAAGGHALLHDAAPGGKRHPQLRRLVEEIEAGGGWRREADVGSFVHFVRA
jgi:predicted O-methyltransferase YrrM